MSTREGTHDPAVDRREFLKRMGGVGAAVAFGPGLLATTASAGVRSSRARVARTAGKVLQVRFGGPGPLAPFWPHFVATDLGYYAKNKVEGSFVITQGQGVQDLVGGSTDADSEFIDRLALAAQKTQSLVGISMMVNSPFSFIVGPGIRSFADLKGKRIGVTTVDSTDALVAAKMLEVNGVGKGSYTMIPAGGAAQKVAAIQSGGIAGALFTQPADLQLLEASKQVRNLGFSSDYVSAQKIAVFVKRSWAESNRAGVVGYLKAQLAACEWLANPKNAARAIKILQTNAKSTSTACRATYDLHTKLDLFNDALDLRLPAADVLLQLSQAAGAGTYKDVTAYFDLSYLQDAESV